MTELRLRELSWVSGTAWPSPSSHLAFSSACGRIREPLGAPSSGAASACLPVAQEPIHTLVGLIIDPLSPAPQVTNVDDEGVELGSGVMELTQSELVLHLHRREAVRWPYLCLRRYGYDSNLFSFESGRRCQTGQGEYQPLPRAGIGACAPGADTRAGSQLTGLWGSLLTGQVLLRGEGHSQEHTAC